MSFMLATEQGNALSLLYLCFITARLTNRRRHPTDLPPEILEPTLKHWYAYQMVYPLALFFVKASILALYHKVFSQQRKFKIWVWVIGAIVATYTVVVVFVNAFECGTRFSDAWSPTFPGGCNNLPKAYFSTAGISIATDFAILLLPIPVLTGLNIQRNRRCRYSSFSRVCRY